MALTQMQLIQSLGEAMAWFERELQWGVAPTELRHLCGRIGELYAALVSNGQLAQQVNQRGYDVVGGNGERISVKTTAMMTRGGHISFNPRSLDVVDRVMAVRRRTATAIFLYSRITFNYSGWPGCCFAWVLLFGKKSQHCLAIALRICKRLFKNCEKIMRVKSSTWLIRRIWSK